MRGDLGNFRGLKKESGKKGKPRKTGLPNQPGRNLRKESKKERCSKKGGVVKKEVPEKSIRVRLLSKKRNTEEEKGLKRLESWRKRTQCKKSVPRSKWTKSVRGKRK